MKKKLLLKWKGCILYILFSLKFHDPYLFLSENSIVCKLALMLAVNKL